MTDQVDVTPARCPVCPIDVDHRPIGTAPDFEYRVTGSTEWSIVECEGCKTRLLDPCPSDEFIPRLYPDDYEPYRFDDLPPLVRALRDRVQRTKVSTVSRVAETESTILDLGCGSGNLLRLLADYGSPTWKLIGWDFPGPHLDRLCKSGRIEVVAAPIATEMIPTDDVDVVILNQVLEHFREPGAVLDICATMLNPGGRLVIETPDVAGIDAQIFRRRHWGGYHVPRHLVMFSRVGLVSLLHASGFEVISARSLASPAFWVQSVHHALSEQRCLRRLAGLATIRNPVALGLAVAIDSVLRLFGRTSNQRVVAIRSHSIVGCDDRGSRTSC